MYGMTLLAGLVLAQVGLQCAAGHTPQGMALHRRHHGKCKGSLNSKGPSISASASLIPNPSKTELEQGASSISTDAPSPRPSASNGTTPSGGCWPYHADLGSSRNIPHVSRKDWWCPLDQQIGFLGFTYALEGQDCSSQEEIDSHIAAVAAHGGHFVRIYGPQCTKQAIWDYLIEACAKHNVALVASISFGFDWEGRKYEETMPLRKQAFFASLKSNPIAPYVIHSVEYGNEPLTDHFQDEATYLQDFKDIKKQLAEYDIPATLSESFGALKAFSAFDELANEVDLFHSQIMPMYEEGVAYATDSWSFWSSEAQQWLDIADGRQIMATTFWPRSTEGHGRPSGTPGDSASDAQLQAYWDLLADQCDYFLKNKIGVFYHSLFADWEGQFSLLDNNGRETFKLKLAQCLPGSA